MAAPPAAAAPQTSAAAAAAVVVPVPAPKQVAALPSCPGHPDAIGTSRTIVVDPHTLSQIGLMQYGTSLPLNDHEVVITFDDGPLPPNTNRILDTLAANCVKATYFLVGSMAHAFPRLVRRIYNEGHSIGTHSQHHPLTFNRMAEPAIAHEVDTGIASVQAAAGDPRAVAPFFRVPGLLRSKRVDNFLASQSLTVWSADEVADDWHHGITAAQIVRLAMRRIAARGHRGVLLLHDIHPATAQALPTLLAELKAHGYRIVHAIPPGARPKSVPALPPTVVAHAHPRVITASARRTAHVIKAAHRRHHLRQAHAHHHRQAHKTHAQLLSALARKRHKTHTAAGDAPDPFEWRPMWR